MGKYSCPCLRPWITGNRVRLPMPPKVAYLVVMVILTVLLSRSSSASSSNALLNA